MSEQENQTSSYRSIFKATSLFGGVQAYQILIGVIRSKFVAILLGPVGMGIQGLYQPTIQLIQGLTSLGLSQSAVRDVAEANGTGDTQQIGLTVAVVKKLVWITGLVGLVATAVLSPILSKTTFGNYDYVVPFIFLSVILLFDQLSAGQRVVLQGMRKLKFLAKSTAIGSTIGLIVSVPLYYLLGIKGIVPTLILNSLTMLCLTWFFSKKVNVEKVNVSNKQTFQKGKSMLKMGLAMSISGIIASVSAYVLRVVIQNESGIDEVGLFSAGFMIINYYFGTVLNAMSTDYYPRLAAVSKDNERCKIVINQQGEIALLIISPLIILCIVYMPLIIRLLYSQKFLLASDYVIWASLGILFKTLSWTVSYSILAKAEAKLFMINELIANIYCLGLNIIGYKLLGLSGLGISFIVSYVLYAMQVYLIAKKKYDFNFSKQVLIIFIVQLSMTVVSFLVVRLIDSPIEYIPATIVLFLSGLYSLKELNSRMSVLQQIKDRFYNGK